MNRRTKLWAVIFLATCAASAEPVAVPALGPRFKQTRERGDALFGYRNGTYPPTDARLNLFRSPSESSTPRPVSPADVPRVVLPPDETILQEALAVLKKGGGGIVVSGGRSHLTFNQKVYKDGDTILVPVRGRPVEIRIVRVSTGSVTLALNETEAVWWF